MTTSLPGAPANLICDDMCFERRALQALAEYELTGQCVESDEIDAMFARALAQARRVAQTGVDGDVIG